MESLPNEVYAMIGSYLELGGLYNYDYNEMLEEDDDEQTENDLFLEEVSHSFAEKFNDSIVRQKYLENVPMFQNIWHRLAHSWHDSFITDDDLDFFEDQFIKFRHWWYSNPEVHAMWSRYKPPKVCTLRQLKIEDVMNITYKPKLMRQSKTRTHSGSQNSGPKDIEKMPKEVYDMIGSYIGTTPRVQRSNVATCGTSVTLIRIQFL